MYNVLINPPVYSYARNSSPELPIALLKLSTYLKGRGEEVALFDFLPSYRFQHDNFYINDGADMEVVSKFGMSGTVFNYKGQKYPLQEFSLVRHTGEYATRFGSKKDRYYCGADKAVFMEFLDLRKPDRIYVSSGITYNYRGTVECIEWCKERYPDVPVQLGGIYPTLCYEHACKHTKADYVHEGKCAEWDACAMDFSALPNKPPYIVRKIASGCPNKCKFCAVGYVDGKVVEFVDIDKDIEEIRSFAETYGCYNIRMWGSNVLMPKGGQLFNEWMDKLIALPYKFRITCPEGFAPELITAELGAKMKRAGFIEIEIPLESSKMLKEMNKRYEAGTWANAVQVAVGAGFDINEVRTAIMPGLPGQTSEVLLEDVKLVADAGVVPILHFFTPVPKSYYYENDEGFQRQDLELLSGMLMPAIKTQEQWNDMQKMISLLGGAEAPIVRIRKYLDKIDGEKVERSITMKEELLGKIATLVADIAEQNQTILAMANKISGQLSKIDDLEKRIAVLEGKKDTVGVQSGS